MNLVMPFTVYCHNVHIIRYQELLFLGDFRGTPSQIMENWAADPEVLKVYARHYKTGEPIPQELIDKLENSGHFNQGFVTTEFMAAALLDMAYHTRNTTDPVNPNEFEKSHVRKKSDLSGNHGTLSQSLLPAHICRRLFFRILRLHVGRSTGCRCFRSI